MNYQPRLPGNAKRNVLAAALAIVFGILIGATSTQAAQPAPGGSCTTGQVTGPINNSLASDANNLRCISSAWAYPVYQLGATTTACNASTAGALQWTTTSFQTCNGSSWGVLGGASLSSITAATTTSSINSGNNSIVWAWNSLASGNTGLMLTTTSSNGTLLSLASTATGGIIGPDVKALSIALSGITPVGYGASYGIYVNNTGQGNVYGLYVTATGGNASYGGYFENLSNYGGGATALYAVASGGTALKAVSTATAIYAQSYSPNGNNPAVQAVGGLYATSSTTAGAFSSTGDRTLDVQNTATNGVTHVFRLLNYYNSGIAFYAINQSTTGTGYTAWFENAGTGKAIYAYSAKGTPAVEIRADGGTANALYARTTSTSCCAVAGMFSAAAGVGVDADGTTYGVNASVSGSTGIGVYGNASSSSGANYGVYGTSSSPSGYGGYFENTSTGWGLFSADDVGIVASGYINWGTTHGTNGYGIRDNSGSMQYKNSGGSWTNIPGAASAPSGTHCGSRHVTCPTPTYDSGTSSNVACVGNTLTATCSGTFSISAVSNCPTGYTGRWITLYNSGGTFQIFCTAN